MEYIYTAMLLHKAGKEVTEENVKKVLNAAGVDIQEAKVKALVVALEGVNIDEAIEKAALTPVAAAAGPAPASEGEKKPKAKEKKEEKKSEEEAAAGLGALFG